MTIHNAHPEYTLSEEDRDFIMDHLHLPTDQLAFRLPRNAKSKFLIHQIQARKKIKAKLPEWYENPSILFPPTLSLEQCSSEATARFKKQLIAGELLIDITGGMGIDTSYLSANFARTFYFEQQEELSTLAEYNFGVLGLNHIRCFHGDAIRSLESNPVRADWIYADPARRDEMQGKVFHLSDCTPDLQAHLPLLFSIAPDILIKTSPVLDIDLTLKTLPGIAAVYVVGFDHECKEVLYHLNKHTENNPEEIPVHTVVLNKTGQAEHTFTFDRKTEKDAQPHFSDPESYLYEPHPAILKAGALKSIAEPYGLKKISVNSHLYTSDTLVADFPGRVFRISAIVKPDAKAIHPFLDKDLKANLTIRNFPSSVSDLRKKLRLKEGGNKYLFATTLTNNQKTVLITEKISH